MSAEAGQALGEATRLLEATAAARRALEAGDAEAALAALDERARALAGLHAALEPAPGAPAPAAPAALAPLLAELVAGEPALLLALEAGRERIARELALLDGAAAATVAYRADGAGPHFDLRG